MTFTASVTPATATGSVAFFDGAAPLGTVALTAGSAALATSSLAVGTHVITAVYLGAPTYVTSTSAAVNQVVNAAATTVTLVAAPDPAGRDDREENLDAVMCRSMLSVDWQGYVHDCDFNQMLGLPIAWKNRPRTHLRELMGADLTRNPIVVKDHCYGCTAGQGSSCGGALAG